MSWQPTPTAAPNAWPAVRAERPQLRREEGPRARIASVDPVRTADPADAAQAAFAAAQRRRPVLLAVPLYRRPELAEQVVASLIACSDDLRRMEAEVVLYNDSPDDAALTRSLERLAPVAAARFPCRLEVNPRNLGFLRTANRALQEAAARGMDALLLNSDTVVFPGALLEMARVARLDPMTGFVNPRSNNATLASLPADPRFKPMAPQAAHAAWSRVSPLLPPVSYTPTAVGFCLLIRWAILAEFGVFDEIYGRGYNEENDLIMRAGRRGYRAVLANHAFVWHEGGASFGHDEATSALEEANRAILLQRYPEYGELIPAYFNSAAERAERMLGALIPDVRGRLRVALDFSSFAAAHNGTFIAGRQLLEGAVKAWSNRYEVCVLCSEEIYAFHGLGATGALHFDVHAGEVFAAVFRVGQPYDHHSLERLVMSAPVIGVFMLDTISLDCSQLASPLVDNLWAVALQHLDLVATTSVLTAEQLERRFAMDAQVLRVRSLHSLDLADYALPTAPDTPPPARPGYLFVVGNHYAHKDVATTANALSRAFPEREVVVLVAAEELERRPPPAADTGRYAPAALSAAANIVRLPAGKLSEAEIGALYANAGAIIFPSHYEGFGMPLLNALAARRPVFVRPLPVFAELTRALGGDANVHVYATTDALVQRLATPPAWSEAGSARGLPGDAVRAAQDIGHALDQAIGRVDYARIVRRLRVVHFAHDLAGGLVGAAARAAAAQGAHDAIAALSPRRPEDFVARVAGAALERAVSRILRFPGVFPALKAGVHLLRRLRGVRTATA